MKKSKDNNLIWVGALAIILISPIWLPVVDNFSKHTDPRRYPDGIYLGGFVTVTSFCHDFYDYNNHYFCPSKGMKEFTCIRSNDIVRCSWESEGNK